MIVRREPLPHANDTVAFDSGSVKRCLQTVWATDNCVAGIPVVPCTSMCLTLVPVWLLALHSAYM